MEKIIYFLMLIFISLTPANSQDLEIFLIKDKTPIIQSPSGPLKLGVSISHQVYFKLTRNGSILQGSQFQRGLNIIKINSRDFYQNPGTYEYILVIKKNQTQKKIKISITARFLDSLETSKIPQIQSSNMKIEIPGHKQKNYKKIGTINPLTHRYDNLDSVNLFGVVSRLIKKKKQKSLQKKRAEISSRKTRCRKMTIGIYPHNNKNQGQTVYLFISLQWEDLSRKYPLEKEW